jgi:hypothetical protein
MASAEFERYMNDRVEDLLDAYAAVRLNPAPTTVARIRARVMAEAAARADSEQLTLRPAVDVVSPPGTSRFGWLQAPWQRRVAAVGMAASLAVGTTAAVFAAPPGSPFYNARLVIESAMMPPVAQLDARLAAYEEQFDDRIAEAEAAIAHGDAESAAAALIAYQDELDSALAEVGDQDSRVARLQAVLDKHIAKLEALAARLPTQVARDNAVKHAIDASERAVAKLQQKQAHGNQNPGANGNGNPGGNGNGNQSQGGGNGNPNAGGNGNQGQGGGNGNQGQGGKSD